jgi:hypothetical protein
VPVLAYAATAVPATMDGGGVLYDTKDPAAVAPLIEAIVGDADLQDAILAAQDAALGRLRARDFGGLLLRFMEQVVAAPDRPHPEVVWDFWQQLEIADRLEALRVYRPAIYQALPLR